MSGGKPELILIDFDGVISKNSPDIILDLFYETLNEFTPISRDYIKIFLRFATSFPVTISLDYLTKSLGISSKDFSNVLREKKKSKIISFKVENDFYEFIEYCKKSKIQYRIFSLADEEHLSVLKMDKKDFYQLNGASKADVKTFELAKKELNIDNILYIDDSPLGLRTGKLSGMTTVMMFNSIFNQEDHAMFKDHIDYTVESFTELRKIIITLMFEENL